MFESDNPYLNGNYAPWREEGDAFDLEIEGELPRELNGALYRVGPNPHFKPLGCARRKVPAEQYERDPAVIKYCTTGRLNGG